jgi:hypothetical protein
LLLKYEISSMKYFNLKYLKYLKSYYQ